MIQTARRADGKEVVVEYVGCTWSENNESGCSYCSGESCALCLISLGRRYGDPTCPHDAVQRHMAERN